MRKKTGVLTTLGAIAMGVTLGAGAASANAAGVTAPLRATIAQADIDAICLLIGDIRTVDEFRSAPDAMAGLLDLQNPCHDAALAKWISLTGAGITGTPPPYSYT